MSINMNISSLVQYGISRGLIEECDRTYMINQLLQHLNLDSYEDTAPQALPLDEILGGILDDAVSRGLCSDSTTGRDLLDTLLMGLMTPPPREVRRRFELLRLQDPQAATDWFYRFSQDTDYIRRYRIQKDIRWLVSTEYGKLDLTINLSKPEKDPKAIAAARNMPKSAYPLCQLCTENEGYAGRLNHPARQNHRIVPMKLAGDDWYVQYSPYAYYDEHCIVFNSQHVPMKITRGTFERLFSFVSQLPHYFLGSNADLPIVGGSILNHDHFQGGNYSFPMDKAGKLCELESPVASIKASVLNWPMSAVCLESESAEDLIDMAEKVLAAWRGYSDPACDVYAETEGNPHNTITPILRKIGDVYKLNLVLRNNRTSEEHPLGIFHPHAPLHHIKKENIGLIEVMGLFILPGRLKTELQLMNGYLTGEKPMVCPAEDDPCCKHYEWLEEIVARRGLCKTAEEAGAVLRSEIASVCSQVLCDAGVYKLDENGLAGIKRFMATLGFKG